MRRPEMKRPIPLGRQCSARRRADIRIYRRDYEAVKEPVRRLRSCHIWARIQAVDRKRWEDSDDRIAGKARLRLLPLAVRVAGEVCSHLQDSGAHPFLHLLPVVSGPSQRSGVFGKRSGSNVSSFHS